MAISTDEFTEIINDGALSHPMVALRLTRAYLCLLFVVNSCEAAEEAFRDWCQMRADQDDLGEMYDGADGEESSDVVDDSI